MLPVSSKPRRLQQDTSRELFLSALMSSSSSSNATQGCPGGNSASVTAAPKNYPDSEEVGFLRRQLEVVRSEMKNVR
jgi:hypothetical protein